MYLPVVYPLKLVFEFVGRKVPKRRLARLKGDTIRLSLTQSRREPKNPIEARLFHHVNSGNTRNTKTLTARLAEVPFSALLGMDAF